MKYMLLMYADPNATKAMSPSERGLVAGKHEALVNKITQSGELLSGEGLDYSWNTVTVRWNQGSPQTTDKPFSSDEQQLTAYYVLECASIDRALELAREILDFHVTAVEVRQIHT